MKDTSSKHAKAFFSLVKTAGSIENKVKKALKPFGITHTQLNILSVLQHSFPQPLSAKAIKERLIVLSPDLTRLIDRLVKKELVTRKTCETNRRSIDVMISPKGAEVYKEAHVAVKHETRNFYKDAITEKEAESLTNILLKIQHE